MSLRVFFMAVLLLGMTLTSKNLYGNMVVPIKDDLHYTLIIDPPSPVLDDISRLSAWDSKLKISVPIETLESAMAASFFPLLGSLQGNLFAGQVDLQKIILETTTTLRETLRQTIKELDNGLPEKPQHFFMAYLPWEFDRSMYPNTDNSISFTGFKVGGNFIGKPNNFNEKVLTNIRKVIANNYNVTNAPFYFVGAIIDLKIQKGKSDITIELLLGPSPREFSLGESASNEQVSLTHMVVPTVDSPTKAPLVLVKIMQAFDSTSKPTAKVSFGPLGGWNKASGLSILDDSQDSIFSCGTRNGSAIYLKGKLKQAVAPGIIGYFANDKAVDFRIYELDLDLTEAKMDNLHLFTQVGFEFGQVRKTFGCFKSEVINGKFETEANNQIKKQLEEVQSKININGLVNLLLSKMEAK